MAQHEIQTVYKTPEEIAQKAMIEGGGLTAAVFSIAAGLLWLRRRLSRDNLEVKRDSGEMTLLATIITERNTAMADAREAWAKRAADAELIGKLSAQVESLERINERMEREIDALRAEFQEFKQQYQHK